MTTLIVSVAGEVTPEQMEHHLRGCGVVVLHVAIVNDEPVIENKPCKAAGCSRVPTCEAPGREPATVAPGAHAIRNHFGE